MNRNIIKSSRLVGLFTALVSLSSTMGIKPIQDVSNEIDKDIGKLKDKTGLIVGCRKDTGSYDEFHKVPLNDKGAFINVYSQEYLQKLAGDDYQVTIKTEDNKPYGLALITKKQPTLYENLTSNFIKTEPQQISGPIENLFESLENQTLEPYRVDNTEVVDPQENTSVDPVPNDNEVVGPDQLPE